MVSAQDIEYFLETLAISVHDCVVLELVDKLIFRSCVFEFMKRKFHVYLE